jgi:hypothetical protein
MKYIDFAMIYTIFYNLMDGRTVVVHSSDWSDEFPPTTKEITPKSRTKIRPTKKEITSESRILFSLG